MSSRWRISCQGSSIFIVPLLPRVPAALILHGWRWFENLKRRVGGDCYRLAELARAELRLDDFSDAPTLYAYSWRVFARSTFEMYVSEACALRVYINIRNFASDGRGHADHVRASANRLVYIDHAAHVSQSWDDGREVSYDHHIHMPSQNDVQAWIDEHARVVIADELFSEALRRRCGLGKRDSRGWLYDSRILWPQARNWVTLQDITPDSSNDLTNQ